MGTVLNPEELIICPYNNSHHIRRMKMGFHLVKCKKNYPDVKIRTCDFNATHRIPEPELQYHHQHCSSRKDIEITLYQEQGEEINKFPVHEITVKTEESWDDSDSASYDPKGYCERNAVLRKIDVESAAKKKNFYIEERYRLKNLMKNQIEAAIIDEENEIDKTKKERVLPETSINDPITEPTPDSISVLLEQIKIGANKSFNSLAKNK